LNPVAVAWGWIKRLQQPGQGDGRRKAHARRVLGAGLNAIVVVPNDRRADDFVAMTALSGAATHA
jgi:hypothetical protein